jgi:predicted metal-dependent hydrolase
MKNDKDREEFFKKFVDVFEYDTDWNDGVSFRITASVNEVWQWIEEKLEEVLKQQRLEIEESIRLGKLRELKAKEEDEERVRLIKDFLYERICTDQKQGRTGYMDTGMIDRIREALKK